MSLNKRMYNNVPPNSPSPQVLVFAIVFIKMNSAAVRAPQGGQTNIKLDGLRTVNAGQGEANLFFFKDITLTLI